jgi:hypothetical protein
MTGVYRRNSDEGNFRITEKVLIKQVSLLGDVYRIIRVTWKQNVLEEKNPNKEKVDKWLATYDYSKRELSEIGGERKCAFLPENLLMFIGNTKFKMIKSITNK